MNRKVIIITLIILGLAGFIISSLIVYNLIPIAEYIIKGIKQAIKDLIGIIRG